MIPPLLDNGPTAAIHFNSGDKKNGGPFLRARQVSGRGKTTRWGSEENLRSRNERAVTQTAACNCARRRSMGLWSKFDPDKTRALIHLMASRSDRRRVGRMDESSLPTGGHAAMPARRLWEELCDTIHQLRCTLKLTDSQSPDDRPAFRKFDPSETKSLTRDQ